MLSTSVHIKLLLAVDQNLQWASADWRVRLPLQLGDNNRVHRPRFFRHRSVRRPRRPLPDSFLTATADDAPETASERMFENNAVAASGDPAAGLRTALRARARVRKWAREYR